MSRRLMDASVAERRLDDEQVVRIFGDENAIVDLSNVAERQNSQRMTTRAARGSSTAMTSLYRVPVTVRNPVIGFSLSALKRSIIPVILPAVPSLKPFSTRKSRICTLSVRLALTSSISTDSLPALGRGTLAFLAQL